MTSLSASFQCCFVCRASTSRERPAVSVDSRGEISIKPSRVSRRRSVRFREGSRAERWARGELSGKGVQGSRLGDTHRMDGDEIPTGAVTRDASFSRKVQRGTATIGGSVVRPAVVLFSRHLTQHAAHLLQPSSDGTLHKSVLADCRPKNAVGPEGLILILLACTISYN